MPIYEYLCEECGEKFEEMQGINDEPLTKRPGCDKNCRLKKLISAGGFILKGDGWYVTDFKGGKKADKDT